MAEAQINLLNETPIHIFNYLLPGEILHDIFCNLLTLQDISKFDVAICNHAKRQLFLDYVGAETSIWHGDRETSFDRNGINWLSNRNINLLHLKCRNLFTTKNGVSEIEDNENMDMAVKISNFGATLVGLSLDFGWRSMDDQYIDKIVKGCPFLKRLELTGIREASAATLVNIVEYLPEIEELCLPDYSDLTVQCLDRVVEVCSNLQSLNIHGSSCVCDEIVLKFTRKFPFMKELHLTDSIFVSDTGVIGIANGCHNLESLDLKDDWNITDEGIIIIAESCSNLRHLDLSGCREITDVSICRIGQLCPKLLTLNVLSVNMLYYVADITDMAIIEIANGCLALQTIKLSCRDKITDRGVTSIAECCKDLQCIELTDCDDDSITDNSIMKVAECCQYLKELSLLRYSATFDIFIIRRNQANIPKSELPGSNITDKSMVMIAERCPSLERVELSGWTSMTDITIAEISKHCHKMKTMYINGCYNFTEDGKNMCKNLLPKKCYLSISDT
jgi:hypothetical protein